MAELKSHEAVANNILGTFEGECADSSITNANGLDITRPVWENLFNSEDFKKGIENGWYIGFLGHPSEVDCQDFQNACIVMTEGHIEDNNKVYGKFNLVDTPVGRIVKSFIDAGVNFGISVRGAGDIYSNSVDPDTFDFRGFDLVAFPAFPDAIPTFSAIAASTDVADKKKYQKICASVMSNVDKVGSAESLTIMQSQFASQSEPYKAIENRIHELSAEDEDEINIDAEKVQCMTNLYIKKSRECEALKKQVSVLSSNLSKTSELHRRKIASIERITSSQLSQVHKRLDDMEELESKYEDVSIKLQDQIAASSKIRANLQELRKSNKTLAEERDELLSENLKYRRRVQASRDQLAEKDKIISSLRSRIDETVNASKVMASKSSNLDAKISNLSSELELTKSRLADFQSAYAQLYANAVGADITGISITASTSVKSLQSMIGTGVTSEEYESFAAPISVDDDYYDDDNELITI